MQITIFCVAAESSGAGEVNWYFKQEHADARYRELVNDRSRLADTVTRFDLKVDDEADPDTVTHLADSAMWEMDYTAIQQRVGTDGASVKRSTLSQGIAA